MYTPATCFTLWENVPMCPLLGSECVSNVVAYFFEHRDASPKSKTIMQLDDSQRAQAGREISPNLNVAKKWNGKKAHRENERETQGSRLGSRKNTEQNNTQARRKWRHTGTWEG